MSDEEITTGMLPEMQLNDLFLPVVLEVAQLLNLVLALIALLSLVITLLDLILLCRDMYQKQPLRPTTKSLVTTRTEVIQSEFICLGDSNNSLKETNANH